MELANLQLDVIQHEKKLNEFIEKTTDSFNALDDNLKTAFKSLDKVINDLFGNVETIAKVLMVLEDEKLEGKKNVERNN